MSDKQVNGAKVNGKPVPTDVAYTEPIRRDRARREPPSAERPPVQPEFWFGPPMPEGGLPPLPEPQWQPKPFDAAAVPIEANGHHGVLPPVTGRLDGDLVRPSDDGYRTEPISMRAPIDPGAAPTELIPRVPAKPEPGVGSRPGLSRADLEPGLRSYPALPKIDSGLLAPDVRPAEPRVAPRVEPPVRPRDEIHDEPWVEPEDDESDDHDDHDDRVRHGKHRRPPRKQPLWKELLILAGVALVLTFFIQHFIGRVYSIPSGSMEQSLHGCAGCSGDRVFVDKIVYEFRDPSPGDVVVFQGPNTWTENDVKTAQAGNAFTRGLQYVGSLIGIAPPDERDFVKRVIAVGGQTVECCDDRMRVMVDGKALDEPYIYWEHGGPDERQRFDRVTVPEGTLWVMGDNRGNSSDSRFQGGGGIRGVVPLGKVIGKARYIVLPPSRWRGVGDHNPQGLADIAAPGWHQGIPAGIGIAAAWPLLWLGRRAKYALTPPRKAD